MGLPLNGAFMIRIFGVTGKCLFGCGLSMCVSICGVQAKSKEAVLYAFRGGNDGAYPQASLYDEMGNLYGTTAAGGGTGCGGRGCGTVFRLAPDGTETVLYAFQGKTDGAQPTDGLIADSAGNLYGTTNSGGAHSNCGTIFKLAPDGSETLLYSFQGGADGSAPYGGVAADKAGNLYGTTSKGGGSSNCSGGCGTVFEVAPDGTETLLHAFSGENDGAQPLAGVIEDKAGNLYGTTYAGGGTGCNGGCGTVFKIAQDRTETVLYAFQGSTDGGGPYGGVIEYKGNLYGTASSYGKYHDGTVFKLAPNSNLSVLYSFAYGHDGYSPYGSLIADSTGNLYGTTYVGGTIGNACGSGCGTVFKLAPDGMLSVLHAFANGSDGAFPEAGVIRDKKGSLFGTTSVGGSDCNSGGCGVVFKLTQ